MFSLLLYILFFFSSTQQILQELIEHGEYQSVHMLAGSQVQSIFTYRINIKVKLMQVRCAHCISTKSRLFIGVKLLYKRVCPSVTHSLKRLNRSITFYCLPYILQDKGYIILLQFFQIILNPFPVCFVSLFLSCFLHFEIPLILQYCSLSLFLSKYLCRCVSVAVSVAIYLCVPIVFCHFLPA